MIMVLEWRIHKDFSPDVFTQIAIMNPSRKSLSKRSQTQQTKIMQESQNLREKLEGGESNMAAKKRSYEARNEHTTQVESTRNSPIHSC